MSHFNIKSLTFYGVAIASVLLLFKTVTAYGETNIQAPAAIDGRYRLVFSPNPNCLKPEPLILSIQQSGIFLNGFLLPLATDAQQARSAEKNPTLTGRLQDQQLSLSGTSEVTICKPVSSASTSTPEQLPAIFVRIYTGIPQNILQGKMTASNMSTLLEFTAKKDSPQPAKKVSSH